MWSHVLIQTDEVLQEGKDFHQFRVVLVHEPALDGDAIVKVISEKKSHNLIHASHGISYTSTYPNAWGELSIMMVFERSRPKIVRSLM